VKELVVPRALKRDAALYVKWPCLCVDRLVVPRALKRDAGPY